MVRLSRYAKKDGTDCWPGEKLLAEEEHLSERQIRRLLEDLKKLGFLHEDGYHICETGGRRKKWKLMLPPAAQKALGLDRTDSVTTNRTDSVATGQIPEATGQIEGVNRTDRRGQPDRCETGQIEQVSPVQEVKTDLTFLTVEQKEQRERESEKHTLSLPPAAVCNAKRLADLVVANAMKVSSKAIFARNDKSEIVRIIQNTGATEEELIPVVRMMISEMDNFNLGRAGNIIAASLSGLLTAAKERKIEAERQAVETERQERFVQDQIDAGRRELDELAAKEKAEEERQRSTHIADDPFCRCESCLPDYWAEKDKEDADLEAFGFESSESASA